MAWDVMDDKVVDGKVWLSRMLVEFAVRSGPRARAVLPNIRNSQGRRQWVKSLNLESGDPTKRDVETTCFDEHINPRAMTRRGVRLEQ